VEFGTTQKPMSFVTVLSSLSLKVMLM